MRKLETTIFTAVLAGFVISDFSGTVFARVIPEEGNRIIHMSPDGFEPREVTIRKGGGVVFENIGNDRHWPASNIHPTHRLYPNSDIDLCGTAKASEIFDACRALNFGETFEFIFDQAGVWKYHDHVNPRLKGTVVVEDGEETAGRGFFSRIWLAIKNFFSGLFVKESKFGGLGGSFREELEELDKNYDPSISRDSLEIFNSKEALFSYVKKYGPGETTKHLHDLERDHGFGFCHNSAHDAGRFAYALAGGEAFQKCSAECHSGCYHGATEAYFKDRGVNNLVKDLTLLCDEELNSFFSHQCVHGIGHGLMAWADYDIYKALASCDFLPYSRASCYSGVFMENIVGGLAQEEGHFTEYLNDDPHFPCTVVDEKYTDACYFYQTSRMVQLFGGDFARVAAACSEISPNHQLSCFSSMGRDVGGANRRNPAGAIAACSLAPYGNLRLACLGGAVQDAFWDPTGQDDAVVFCRDLSSPEEKTECYNVIAGRAREVLGSAAGLKTFCAKFEREYQTFDFCR